LARRGAADQHDKRRAKHGGLIDNALVLVDGSLTCGSIQRAKKSATDVGDNFEPLTPAQVARSFDSVGMILRRITPNGDSLDARRGEIPAAIARVHGLVVMV